MGPWRRNYCLRVSHVFYTLYFNPYEALSPQPQIRKHAGGFALFVLPRNDQLSNRELMRRKLREKIHVFFVREERLWSELTTAKFLFPEGRHTSQLEQVFLARKLYLPGLFITRLIVHSNNGRCKSLPLLQQWIYSSYFVYNTHRPATVFDIITY